MTDPVFIDTNILVYRQDSSDPAKQSRAHDWIAFLSRRSAARFSFQVLQDLYAHAQAEARVRRRRGTRDPCTIGDP